MTLQDLRIQEAIHSDYVIPNHFFIALMTSNFPMRLSRIAWKYSWKTSPSLVVLSTTASKIGEDAKKMRGNQPCSGIEVDKAKIEAIYKLPYPTNVKVVRSFLGHAGFYNRHLENYITTEKELLAVVFAFDKFRQYLVLSKTIVFTDHSALRYLFTKQDAKPLLIRWILLLQEFDIEIHDKKGAENLAANHLSRLENPDLWKLTRAETRDLFPEERLIAISNKNNEPWLYLMRRSLEVLRKFHWMILGGRFNQLSHVSSPLLSKPGEY
ncbi:reverse transcriptase domain-containing protein [Tanacetum coccineum]